MDSERATRVLSIRSGRRTELVYDLKGKRIASQIFDLNKLVAKEGSIPDGPVIECYRDGRVKRKVTYRNERPHGWSFSYYPGRELWEEQHFVNGKLDGPSRMYRKDGNLWREASYRKGKLNGCVVAYHESGHIETISNHEKGKLHGGYECYDQMGFLKEKGSFRNGKKEGIWTAYEDDDGSVFRDTYEGGRLLKREKYRSGVIGN